MLFLPCAQSHRARMQAGLSCLSSMGLNLPSRVGQGAELRGQTPSCGTDPVIPGVRSCWRRQEGARELQGVVLALEQPPEQGCFKAGHVILCIPCCQFLFLRGVGTPSIPKEPPAPLCSTPHTASSAAETSPSHGINRLKAESCQAIVLQQVGPAGEEELGECSQLPVLAPPVL